MRLPKGFKSHKLLPAIIQDSETNEVLMLAYLNEESYLKTMQSGKTWFWSRSRQKLWNKGETSGNYQLVSVVMFDCDEDAVLIKVKQLGKGACHTGHHSCFYKKP